MTTTAVWARLPELPIELYDSRFLSWIGNQLGTLLKIDAHTMDNQRGRYARLCVQIDLDQLLTFKIRIGNKLQKIQYEGITAICFECGCVGHRAPSCRTILAPPPPTLVIPIHTSPSNEVYGDWMLVTRKKFSKLKVLPNLDTSSPDVLVKHPGSPITSRSLEELSHVDDESSRAQQSSNVPVLTSNNVSSAS
ncbi:DUF4283 domain-containing protein/zf-CCHC_4 domain-containing protein [Fagus crenata]